MNERVKLIRKQLGMTQEQLAHSFYLRVLFLYFSSFKYNFRLMM